jgi:hypothetical protein
MRRAIEHTRGPGDGVRVAGLAALAMLAAGGAGMLLAALTLVAVAPPRPAGSELAGSGRAKPTVQSQPTAPAATAPDLARPPRPGRPPPRALARSQPTRVVISKIGVDAQIVGTGVDGNGAIEVPPLTRPELAGWYRFGPSPGEAGSAVIVGHVDSSESGPAVFFNLGALVRGDIIKITRVDRSVAAFKVDSVEVYAKATFPAEQVHRPTPYPALRLITCGGRFDRTQRNYLDSVIVFASLAEQRR